MILAVIPARGGSKGIPGKNIKDLYGQPLISYTIQAALDCKKIDRVVVSTDSEEIAGVAKKYGADVPFLRPAALAMDTSKTIDAVIDVLERMNMWSYCSRQARFVPRRILKRQLKRRLHLAKMWHLFL